MSGGFDLFNNSVISRSIFGIDVGWAVFCNLVTINFTFPYYTINILAALVYFKSKVPFYA